MKKCVIAIALFCCISSCIKDEAAGKECDVESAWVEGTEYEQYFYQTAEMKKDVSSTETDIQFSVRSLISLSKEIPLNFKITDGATIHPANGSKQDFTRGPVVYTVTSEDGAWQRQYKVTFREAPLPAQKFSFEHVETKKEMSKTGSVNDYCWGTGNSGAGMMMNGKKPEDFPTYSTPDCKEGKGVCLKTLSAGAMGAFLWHHRRVLQTEIITF